MDEDDSLDSAFDEYLDRALRGETIDAERFLADRPGLDPDSRARLRRRIESLAGTKSARGLPFDRIGEFRLLPRLGEGGMGVVFLAEQESLGRRVALKLLRPELVGATHAEKRFEREAKAIAQLRHPNIVAVHATGEDKGVRYLAMELVEGEGLDMILRSSAEPLPPTRAVQIALDIARALAAAHAQGVIHRDVKPSNVRIARDGRAMLVDFGLAQLDGASSLSQSGAFHGTPYFASPEQVDARSRTLDSRTDVYSLGATLYHCVAGRPPFEGTTTAHVFQQILSSDPPAPRALNARVSRDLEMVIGKAMEKRREGRYASAQEFAADLQALLEVRPIRARPASVAVRARTWFVRRPVVAVLVGAALLAATVFAVAAVVEHGRTNRAFESELARAGEALSRGEFSEALSACDRALGLRPGDARALTRRALSERENARSRSHSAVEDARHALEQYGRHCADASALEAGLEPLRRGVTTRHLAPVELAQLSRDGDRSAELARGLEQDFFAVLQALEVAHGLDPDNADVQRVRADAYIERFRAALERRDVEAQDRFREMVRANDLEARYSSELAGLGSFSLATEPAGARVFLFRYLEQVELPSGGEHRLVPVPVDAATGANGPTPVVPGTWTLRVFHGTGELEAGDLVLRVAGRPVEGAILVLRDEGGSDGDVHDFDRLVSIGGHEVRDMEDANALRHPAPASGERDFVFERDGRTFTLRAASTDDLGVHALTLARLLELTSAPVSILHRGAERDGLSTPGLRVRLTAIPLFVSSTCSFGATPVVQHALERGSYLALVEDTGFETCRLPFVVERGRDTQIGVRLYPDGTTPPGFVFVPGGAFQAGGDPVAYAAWAKGPREVSDFWMAEREVTEREYAEFLDDPDTASEIDASPILIRVPRKAADAGSSGAWKRGADGHYEGPFAGSGYPVGSIAPADAAAYAAWRDRKARESGEAFRYALPTEEEWEKAARGVDGRLFVFGDHYAPAWMKSLYARERESPFDEFEREPGLRFPVDESVYGIYDLAGSMWEPCAGVSDFGRQGAPARGGAYTFMYEASFHAAARAGLDRTGAQSVLGIRLVAHRAGSASSR